MMHFIGNFLLIFWLGVLGNHSITADKDTKVQTELKKIMEELHAIGLSVVVVDKGQIVYSESLGYKSIDTSNGCGKSPCKTDISLELLLFQKRLWRRLFFG